MIRSIRIAMFFVFVIAIVLFLNNCSGEKPTTAHPYPHTLSFYMVDNNFPPISETRVGTFWLWHMAGIDIDSISILPHGNNFIVLSDRLNCSVLILAPATIHFPDMDAPGYMGIGTAASQYCLEVTSGGKLIDKTNIHEARIVAEHALIPFGNSTEGYSLLDAALGYLAPVEYDILNGFNVAPVLTDNSTNLFAFSRSDGKLISWQPGNSSRTDLASLSTGTFENAFISAFGPDLYVFNVYDNGGTSIYLWESSSDTWILNGSMTSVDPKAVVTTWGNEIVYAYNTSGEIIVEKYSTTSSTITALPAIQLDEIPRQLGVFDDKLFLNTETRLYRYDAILGAWDFLEHRYPKRIMVINNVGVWLIG